MLLVLNKMTSTISFRVQTLVRGPGYGCGKSRFLLGENFTGKIKIKEVSLDATPSKCMPPHSHICTQLMAPSSEYEYEYEL